jgi:hypothetical protein
VTKGYLASFHSLKIFTKVNIACSAKVLPPAAFVFLLAGLRHPIKAGFRDILCKYIFFELLLSLKTPGKKRGGLIGC